MADNVFDQFDEPSGGGNVFDQFDAKPGPEPEGPIMSGAREFANNVVPGVVGTLVGGAGALAGSALGLPGTLAGGAAGFIGGAALGEQAQEAVKHFVGYDDSEQRRVNREANHYSSLAGELGGAMVGMSPAKVTESIGKEVAARAFSGAAQAGFGAASTKLQGGDLDAGDLALQFAAGAIAPGLNRAGKALNDAGEQFAGQGVASLKRIRNKPGAAEERADVNDSDAEVDVGNGALSQSPAGPTGETVGTPESNKPTNSQGAVAAGRPDESYSKKKNRKRQQAGGVTTGDFDPATVQAADAAGGTAQAPSEAKPAEQPVTAPVSEAAPPQHGLNENFPVDPEFPKPGEPLATGENDAAPLPPDNTERFHQAAADANEQLDSADQAFNEPSRPKLIRDLTEKRDAALAVGNKIYAERLTRKLAEIEAERAPEIKGEAALPKSEAQAEAGNYKKARLMDFGKPMALETHAGSVRKGKGWEHELPYDYGYFNKTKSTDGEGIDWMRPKEGAPERGDKHFVIDQKNETTGKYDEPKVMQYVKDKDTAIDLYNRGFGDGKGPARLHDITEVSRTDLTKYLAKHTTKAPTKPYGKPIPKTVKDRVVFKDLLAKASPEDKARLQNASEEQVAAAIKGKRLRKYGDGKGNYPIEGLPGSSANTKRLAAERTAQNGKIEDWFKKSAIEKDKLDAESDGDLLNRVREHGYPIKGDWVPKNASQAWFLAREARDLLRKPTPGNIATFRKAEQLLRGPPEAVEAYRNSKRGEAQGALDRHMGDDAVNAAEAAQAKAHQGVNNEENAMIENIARKRGDADALPDHAPEARTDEKPKEIKTKADLKNNKGEIDVSDGKLAAQYAPKAPRAPVVVKKGKPIEKMSLKELTEEPKVEAKKEEFEKAEAANKGESVKAKFSPEMMKRFVELSEKAKERAKKFGPDESGAVGANMPQAVGLNKFFKRLRDGFQGKRLSKLKSSFAHDRPQFLQHVDDSLFKMHKEDQIVQTNALQAMERMFKEHGADEAAQRRIYEAREADSAHVDLPGKKPGKTNIESLTGRDKKLYEDYIKPVLDENDEWFRLGKALFPDRFEAPEVEHHISRLTKGDTAEYNVLRDDPTGGGDFGVKVSASMAKERPFVVLERQSDGKRFVVQTRNNGFNLWENYKSTKMKDPNFKFEANKPYEIKNKNGTVKYTMREAMSREIEQHARGLDGTTKPMKYIKNAAMSAYLTNTHVGSMVRHLMELERLKTLPEWKKMSTTNGEEAMARGYDMQGTKLPNFQGKNRAYFHEDLKRVLDDYAGPGFGSDLDKLREMNRRVTKLLFWAPTAHIFNVMSHWIVGRGFDNLNVKRGAETFWEAIKSVRAQDDTQKRLMRAGAGLIYPGVNTQRFADQAAKLVGAQLTKNPSKWGPIADYLGIPLKTLSDRIYEKSSRMMWAANDVFLTQRILELEKKGLSTTQAIRRAERDIPNYRLPSTVMGSRLLQKALADPAVSAFGRYHYGMYNAHANTFKDLLGKHARLEDRVDALGKVLTMSTLAFLVYPAADKLAQLVTGNEEGSFARRGPIGVPYHMLKSMQGKEDIASAARSSFTLTPLTSTVIEAMFNHDFRGKNIVEPGDMEEAFNGSPRAMGRVGVQVGEHAARGLISPLGTFSTNYKKDEDADDSALKQAGKAIGRSVRDQFLDVKNPSDKAQQWDQKSHMINMKNARLRERKGGAGPLEEWFNSATKPD